MPFFQGVECVLYALIIILLILVNVTVRKGAIVSHSHQLGGE